ncbi:hypothetical protein Gohar_012099, partial [Gossypium harknessii]|nr:hypothetical protein [Gossypium harknessii]
MIALTTGLGITITNVLNYEDNVVEIKMKSKSRESLPFLQSNELFLMSFLSFPFEISYIFLNKVSLTDSKTFLEQHGKQDCFPLGTTSSWVDKFNVAGVALEDESGYGGVLSDDKGVACALFSGPICGQGIGNVIHRQGKGMADALTEADILRPSFFKALVVNFAYCLLVLFEWRHWKPVGTFLEQTLRSKLRETGMLRLMPKMLALIAVQRQAAASRSTRPLRREQHGITGGEPT